MTRDDGCAVQDGELVLDRAAYHRLAGDLPLAQQHAEQALVIATTPRQPIAVLAAHRLLSALATTANRHAEAAAHLDQALAPADTCAAPYERALIVPAVAELHLQAGRRPEARAVLDEARTIVARREARTAWARAEALAARIATPPVTLPVRPAAPGGPTVREIEVLRLLAWGATESAITRELCIGVKTSSGT
jgi:DNA-binding NarL/FixJ family response regulator